MKKCCIETCVNARPNFRKGLSFFKFPRNIRIRTKWINGINSTKKITSTKTLFVCSYHFERKQMVMRAGKINLIRNSVPIIFPPSSTDTNIVDRVFDINCCNTIKSENDFNETTLKKEIIEGNADYNISNVPPNENVFTVIPNNLDQHEKEKEMEVVTPTDSSVYNNFNQEISEDNENIVTWENEDQIYEKHVELPQESSVIKRKISKMNKSSLNLEETANLNRCMEVISNPIDEFSLFGDFIANELRALKDAPHLQSKLKRQIQRFIVDIADEHAARCFENC